MSEKRDLFAELIQGVENMSAQRQGKISPRGDVKGKSPPSGADQSSAKHKMNDGHTD